MNHGLRMVDLKLVTKEFYQYIDGKVNGIKGEKIEFRRDPKFLVRPKMLRNV